MERAPEVGTDSLVSGRHECKRKFGFIYPCVGVLGFVLLFPFIFVIRSNSRMRDVLQMD